MISNQWQRLGRVARTLSRALKQALSADNSTAIHIEQQGSWKVTGVHFCQKLAL